MSTIAFDLDGTLLTKSWPKVGTWQPGAQEALRELIELGHTCYIYSARVSPYWPDGRLREPGEQQREINMVRDRLDEAGFQAVDIWCKEGKPFWDLLIDDKAMWYPGRPGSWKAMVPKILARVGDEDGFDYIMGVANGADPG